VFAEELHYRRLIGRFPERISDAFDCCDHAAQVVMFHLVSSIQVPACIAHGVTAASLRLPALIVSISTASASR